jgi:type III secretion protein N (ATPase)
MIGELVGLRASQSNNQLMAEVIGLDGLTAILAPIGDTRGLTSGCPVIRTGAGLRVPVGNAVLGRVLDGLGRPLDSDRRGPIKALHHRPSEHPPMPAMHRTLIKRPLSVGVRAIDGLMTCAEGQRVGIYGEPGGGKSTLLGQLVRGADAEIIVVGLIGERGREVGEFIARQVASGVQEKTVLVVATSDRPALERMRAAHTATTIAEAFRDEGRRVLLVMDSITRFARAMREVGLAAGEPPTRRGFPPSVLAQLPQLLERAGPGAERADGRAPGVITAFYTVLIEGDGTDDPIAEETKSLLDGHISLSPKLAASGQFPAIDVLASRSRTMDGVVSRAHRDAANHLRQLLHKYQEAEFLIQVGEYRAGADPLTDEAVAKIEAIRSFLRQGADERSTWEETTQWLGQLQS